VKDLDASIAFYRNLLGLELKSRSKDFAILEVENIGVFPGPGVGGGRQRSPPVNDADWKCIRNSKFRTLLGRLIKPGKLATKSFRNRTNTIEVRKPSDPDGYTWALVALAKG
jgi:catechol 2,3-dioxygenase-like lactoylglutathione lyase family enzyme